MNPDRYAVTNTENVQADIQLLDSYIAVKQNSITDRR